MSRWDYGSSQKYSLNYKTLITHTPCFDAVEANLQSFYYQFQEYSYGISIILGDMVKDTFQNPATAKTKYGWDLARMRAAELAEEPREPMETNTPEVSDTEDEDASARPQKDRKETNKEVADIMTKPRNWNTMKSEEKTDWEKSARRRAKRAQTRVQRNVHSVRKSSYKKEQQFLYQCKMFQLLVTTAFSNPKVVEYLRSKNVQDPFDKIGLVKKKYGQISGTALYLEEKKFERMRPRANEDVDLFLTRYKLKKQWLEIVKGAPFTEDESVNRLLEKLSTHPAFGKSFTTDHYRLTAKNRPTHEEIIDSAGEIYRMWAANQAAEKYKRRQRGEGRETAKEATLYLEEDDEEGERRGKGKGKRSGKGSIDGEKGSRQEWWLTAVCYNCNETGHTKRFCPKLTKRNPSRPNSSHRHTKPSEKSKQGKQNKEKTKSKKVSGKGITLIRGETNKEEEDEEGEGEESDDSTSEYDLIVMETEEAQEGGGEENENKGGGELSEHQGQTNDEYETPERVSEGRGLSSGPTTRTTLRGRAPHTPTHSSAHEEQRLNTSTTSAPYRPSSPQDSVRTHASQKPISRPKPPKPSLAPTSKAKTNPQAHTATPQNLATTPVMLSKVCKGRNSRKVRCGVKIGIGGSTGKSGNMAKRLEYSDYCGYHYAEDPLYPDIDLRQDPSMRPPPTREYPGEEAMRETWRERERERVREHSNQHLKKPEYPLKIIQSWQPVRKSREKGSTWLMLLFCQMRRQGPAR